MTELSDALITHEIKLKVSKSKNRDVRKYTVLTPLFCGAQDFAFCGFKPQHWWYFRDKGPLLLGTVLGMFRPSQMTVPVLPRGEDQKCLQRQQSIPVRQNHSSLLLPTPHPPTYTHVSSSFLANYLSRETFEVADQEEGGHRAIKGAVAGQIIFGWAFGALSYLAFDWSHLLGVELGGAGVELCSGYFFPRSRPLSFYLPLEISFGCRAVKYLSSVLA